MCLKMRSSLLFLLLLLCSFYGYGQCTTTVISSNGYDVDITLTPTTVDAPDNAANCQFGYNFTLNVDYSITFSGSNIPASLDNMSANVVCGGSNFFLELPDAGGIGTASVSNYRNDTDCETVTPQSMGCNSFNIAISGPGISFQTVSCAVVLPIDLLSFNAQLADDFVQLSWATTAEINNDYFTVERSKDASNWEIVSKLAGAGDSNTELQYDAIDRNPYAGVSYYRLKQTDFDGQYSYSAVESVVMGKNTRHEISIYPNPTTNELIIRGAQVKEDRFGFFNMLGQNVDHLITIQDRDEVQLSVDVSNLSSGMYFLKTADTTSKFYKQ